MFEFEIMYGHSVLYINDKDKQGLDSIEWIDEDQKFSELQLSEGSALVELNDLSPVIRKRYCSEIRRIEKIVATQAKQRGKYVFKTIEDPFIPLLLKAERKAKEFHISTDINQQMKDGKTILYTHLCKCKFDVSVIYIDFNPSKGEV